MGVCLGKLHPGRRSVNALPAPPPSSAPVPAVSAGSPKPTKANLVAPQPPPPTSSSFPEKPAEGEAQHGSFTTTTSGGGGPGRPPLSRSQTVTSRSSMKRSTFAVPGGDTSSSLITSLSPAAAAAVLIAGGGGTPSSAPLLPSAVDQASSIVPKAPQAKQRHMSVRPELQRGASGQRLVDRRRGKKPVNVALDVLFKDERARIGFFRFLQATATAASVPSEEELSSSPPPLASKTTKLSRATVDYREDCVLFWLEISDLLKIPSGGSFHAGLMQDLFDVYVAQHAPRLLPMVSAAERDPLAQYLSDRNADRALLAFKMLLLDVLEIVTAAFDDFVRDDSKLGFAHATRNESMRNVLGRLVKANFGASSSDRRAQLHDILNTPQLCRMFREFLQERNSVENLLFVIDALAYEDLVNAFDCHQQEAEDTDGAGLSSSRHEYCLRQAHKIFNKYIRYGSKAEICLGATVKARLLRSIADVPILATLFNDAVLLCCAELVQSHLDVFYRSRAFLDYQMARQEAVRAARAASAAQGGRRRLSAPPASQSESGPTAVAHPIELDAPTLGEILHGIGAQYFRDFLKEEGVENTILFYKEVEQFQLLPHGQKHYIQIKARRIFDRFVRRGGKLEIELPLDVRRDILFKLSSPSEFTFADALRYVVNLWEAKHLPKFRFHPSYRAMRVAMDAGITGGATTTAADTMSRRESSQISSPLTMPPPSLDRPASTLTGQSDQIDINKITLREFLELEFLRKYFRHFLEKEQCMNELHFYFEIATFQQLPTSDYLSRQAKKLYNRFCDPQSRECVVLREDLKAELQLCLARPSPAMFRKTQEEIFSFFQSTLFPKFQQSEVYRTIQITPAQLKTARQSAEGAVDPTAMDGPGNAASGGGEASGSRSGRRRSGSSLPELAEESVSVALILENQETRALFLLFAEEIFCTESIYFWLDCNEYKDIPHRNYLKLRAQKIYRKYICGRAKLQVNLESAITKEIVKNLDDPSRTLFLVAQRSITKMLERDTLPKFRKSKHYKPCLQILRAALMKTRG